MKQFFAVFLVGMMIPYITTLACTGLEGNVVDEAAEAVSGEDVRYASDLDGEKKVIVIRNEREVGLSVEEFLPYVLAAQIPADFEMETLKAQAILARTYIYREIEAAGMGDFVFEEALDMDAWSIDQMKERWGGRSWEESYRRLQAVVEETAGQVLAYENEYVEPLFCYASSGITRTHGEEYPYLKQTASPGDLLAVNYRSALEFTAAEMASRINEIPDGVDITGKQLPMEIQIVERDSAGYVMRIQVGQKTYTGEEVQYALGLPSACYSFEQEDEKIRVVCNGVGHGYGFSQFGANEMAKEGKTYPELLNYYFQNVEIVLSRKD